VTRIANAKGPQMPGRCSKVVRLPRGGLMPHGPIT